MKIGNTKTLCKKGKHGVCDHGIYSYNNKITIRCMECAKENKKNRSKNPDKYNHDREYTKQWYNKNKDYCLAKSQERNKKHKEEKDKLVKIFLDKNREKIIQLLKKIDSPLSFIDIEKYCYHFNIVLFRPVKRLIIRNKRNDLLRRERFRQSAYTKYNWGVVGNGFNNYPQIPEIMKEKIRAEYKLNAKKIVDNQMKELCKTL